MKRQSFEKSFTMLRFLWVALLVSLLVYGIVGMMIRQLVMGAASGFVQLDPSIYLMLLTILSLASGVLGFVVLVPLARRQAPREVIARNAPLSLEELARLMVEGHTIRMVIAEVIAVFGLFLFLLNGRIFHLNIFLSVAVLVHLLIFPRRATWEEAERLWRRRKME